MQLSNRQKATIGLVGAAVVAGLAVGGGGVPSFGTVSASSTTVTATTTATSVGSAAASGAPTDAGSVAAAAIGAPAGAVAASWSGDPGKIVLVLDSSRSMRTAVNGTTRMDEAKQALSNVVDQLPSGTQVGLRVYGSNVAVGDPNKPSDAACHDSRQVLPIAPVDKPKLDAVISVFTPHGYTPTSYALQEAAKDLGPSGKRTIVLVSDGEESCGIDPAATAQELRRAGIDLTINTVGLHADQATTTQLQQVAAAGGGTYTSAQSSSELEGGLRQILDRMRSGTSGSGAASGWGAASGSTAGAGTAAAAPGDTRETAAGFGAGPAATPSGNQTLPAGARQAQSTTGGGLSTGGFFIPALLLIALFFWLKDH